MRRAFTALLFCFAIPSFGWSDRGHSVICEAAVRLLQPAPFREWAIGHSWELAYFCVAPDLVWKRKPYTKEKTKDLSAAHHLNPEMLGWKLAEVPLDYAAVVQRAKAMKVDAVRNFGSLWWRADQFQRLSLETAKVLPRAAKPHVAWANYETQMGLLGHFVGDASVPFHVTDDYDGWEVGHGGIHEYFEVDSLNTQPLSLAEAVYQRASKLPPLTGTTLERMKAISLIADARRAEVLKLDVLTAPSVKASGSKKRIEAKRGTAEEGAKQFGSILVASLADSASLLAALWNESYKAAGEPAPPTEWHNIPEINPKPVPIDYVP